MKLFPITGLQINKTIQVPYTYFKFNNKDILHSVCFSPKNQLQEFFNKKEIIDIEGRFPNITTFAVIQEYINQSWEVHHIRVCLSILYASFLYNRFGHDIPTFTGRSDIKIKRRVEFPLFTPYADIRIGDKSICANDFDQTIPCFYSYSSETEVWRKGRFCYCPLIINEEIDDEIANIVAMLLSNTQIANKLAMSFNFIYDILPQTDITTAIILTSTILETLLLDDAYRGDKKKSISVRAACLAHNKGDIEEKKELANFISRFYEMRSEIVHEGRVFINLSAGTGYVLQNAKSSIFVIIRRICELRLKSIQDIIKVVENNVKKDGLVQGFDYLI